MTTATSTNIIAAPCNSDVNQLGLLGSFAENELHEEIPLFAADGSFAYRCGGKCTQAFMEALPPDWLSGHLLVDSILVWMQRDRSLSSRWFHHEVLPGDGRPVCEAANKELDAEHMACALGAPSFREFLVGDVSPVASEQDFSLICTSPAQFPQRDEVLRAARDTGRLKAVTIGLNTLHQYTGRSFQRTLPTATAGFHFFIRATRGSKRPVINGFRNAVGPSFTGPWSSIPKP